MNWDQDEHRGVSLSVIHTKHPAGGGLMVLENLFGVRVEITPGQAQRLSQALLEAASDCGDHYWTERGRPMKRSRYSLGEQFPAWPKATMVGN